MIKRGKYIFIFSVMLLLIIPLISAGFFDNVYSKITGKATQGTTALNVTIGNSAPTITYVQIITATNPTDDTSTSITFNFTVTDTDGAGNIDTSSGRAEFTRAGEPTRSDTSCSNYAGVGNDMNFSCTIDMWYFDENGAWDINASANDINDIYAENTSESFTYNLLPGMKMSPTALGWGTVGLTDTDTSSDDNPIQVNNTGNDKVDLHITGLDLQGEYTKTEYIYAVNFTVDSITTGCSGTALVNNSGTNITSASLFKGNHSLNLNDETSGQEELFFCLKGVPQDISSQSYSSTAFGSWTIEIVS